MAIALDTSVLVDWEKAGAAPELILSLEGPFYVPAHAAAEFLSGTHPPVPAQLRDRARRLYEDVLREMVDVFAEADAAQLAALNAELRATGKQMKFFDCAIAATVIGRGDQLMTLDNDFDRLGSRIKLVKPGKSEEAPGESA